jgi:hypothetical protein
VYKKQVDKQLKDSAEKIASSTFTFEEFVASEFKKKENII